MQVPTSEKFVYSLFQLPSTFAQDSEYDQKLFQDTYIATVKTHKKWIRQNAHLASHLCLPTNYGLTSGELAMIHYRTKK